MNWTGVIFGFFSALMIGLGFMYVIKFEYLIGAYRWKWSLGLGLALIALSLFMPNFMLTALFSIVGGVVAWGAMELPHQEERVDDGLFKAHPKRAERPRLKHDHSHGHGTEGGLGKWWSF
ncbi:MAG: DUF4491 family protein [Chloroflexia bacterium]